jgi:hypothetical protein
MLHGSDRHEAGTHHRRSGLCARSVVEPESRISWRAVPAVPPCTHCPTLCSTSNGPPRTLSADSPRDCWRQAIDYLESLGGPPAIQAHNLALRAAAHDGVVAIGTRRNLSGLEVIGARARDGPLASPILTFSLPPPWTSHTFAAAMFARGIVVKQAGRSASANEGGPTMPMQACRLSFHVYTSKDDVANLLLAVDDVLANPASGGVDVP